MDKNWSINETKQLFSLVYNAASEGKGLSGAFNEMAKSSGKSVNSIRNYYYSQLKLFEMMPAISQCPIVVSFPFDTSVILAKDPAGFFSFSPISTPSILKNPSFLMFGIEKYGLDATALMVLLPASP